MQPCLRPPTAQREGSRTVARRSDSLPGVPASALPPRRTVGPPGLLTQDKLPRKWNDFPLIRCASTKVTAGSKAFLCVRSSFPLNGKSCLSIKRTSALKGQNEGSKEGRLLKARLFLRELRRRQNGRKSASVEFCCSGENSKSHLQTVHYYWHTGSNSVRTCIFGCVILDFRWFQLEICRPPMLQETSSVGFKWSRKCFMFLSYVFLSRILSH